MFYFKQNEFLKEPIPKKKSQSQYQLRPVDDLMLLIYDEGVLADYDDFDLTF